MVINYKNDFLSNDDKLIKAIQNTIGKPLSKLSISDLASINKTSDQDLMTENDNRGVYIFRDALTQNPFYVGKCSARVFVERIPMHFDLRPTGWFNQYLKYLANYLEEQIKNQIPSDSAMRHALDYVLNHHELVLIKFDVKEYKHINDLESKLRIHLNPVLNSKKKNKA
jgi:hypothetical protein